MLDLDCKESWVLKKWWFWTVVLEKTLESPLGSRETQSVHRKGDQSWCSLEGLMFKLKLQYFGHLMWRADPFEKTLMLRKMEGRQRRGLQWMRWLDGITASMDISLVSSRSWWWTARPGVLKSMGSQRVRHDWAAELNCCSITQSYPTLCDPMDCSTPGFPGLHYCPEFAQTHVHWFSDTFQLSHSLSLSSPPTLSLAQHRLFTSESALCVRWPKDWSFSFSFCISPSNEYSGLISFRVDWFDILAVQGTLKSLPQHSLKTSILWHQPSLWSSSHICTWLLEKL